MSLLLFLTFCDMFNFTLDNTRRTMNTAGGCRIMFGVCLTNLVR